MHHARGMMVYGAYRVLTSALSPLLRLHLHWRRLRGLEHPLRWPERLGRASIPRPPGPLLWFHAVSLGEGMAAIPVIVELMRRRPEYHVLMTTSVLSAFEVIKDFLPSEVLYQFAPIDTPASIKAFLGYWKPSTIFLLESELWPNLIMCASESSITLALLNARVSAKSFGRWSMPLLLPLVSLLLSKFSLITPLSNLQAIRFQLLQAPPFIVNFSGDLKFAVANSGRRREDNCLEDLKVQLHDKKVWLAASVHTSEEKVFLAVHKSLMQMHHDIFTIIVPRHPQHGRELFEKLKREGHCVSLRSRHDKCLSRSNIYVVDTLGELRQLYKISPIAIVGGSFFPELSGHNVSEPAAAGCAVLTGPHVGHFSQMILEMQSVNPKSVLQLSGEAELAVVLNEFFKDPLVLKEHQLAAKSAFHSLSTGITMKALKLIECHVLRGITF
ncbi:hypothetical protein MLD38_035452 [Melastoma candidum]|uniref:Uncharacterized protein n=1 Tax=Melastoma candidum TaxID=119954 RepID=A0ACB9LGV9_9MYRT|nr:hypothetical protein MLD38_035452 [Melastoma candidum]